MGLFQTEFLIGGFVWAKAMKAVFAVLFVIAIALSGAIVCPCRFSSGMKPVRVSGDFSAIAAAIKMYQVNAGRYPKTSEGLRALVERPGSLSDERSWVKLADSVPLDPWQTEYRYTDRSMKRVAHPFEIRSAGPDGLFDTEDDISSLDPD